MRKFVSRILDTSTKILRIDVRYFARGGAWLTGSQFAMSAMAMISAIAFANLLPDEVFGHYRFALAIVGILSITNLAGMNTAFLRAASRGYEQTLYPILKRKIAFSLLGTVGALASAGYYFVNDNMLLAGALSLSAFFIPLIGPLKIYDVLLQSRRHFSTVSVYRVIAQAISLSALVAVMFFSDNLFALLIAYFLPATLTEAFLLYHTLQKHPLTDGVDKATIRYGYHLSFLRGAQGIAGNLQNIILFHFLGPVSVAMYYFATAPTEQARALISQLETLLFPKTAQESWHVGAFLTFMRKIAPFLFVIAIGTIAYILLAPFLFSIFFPAYTDAVLFSQLYAPTILLTAMTTVLNTIVKSKGSVKTQYIIMGTDTALQFLVVVPMIYYFGVLGLIGALAFNKFVQVILLICRLFIYPRFYLKQTT